VGPVPMSRSFSPLTDPVGVLEDNTVNSDLLVAQITNNSAIGNPEMLLEKARKT